MQPFPILHLSVTFFSDEVFVFKYLIHLKGFYLKKSSKSCFGGIFNFPNGILNIPIAGWCRFFFRKYITAIGKSSLRLVMLNNKILYII